MCNSKQEQARASAAMLLAQAVQRKFEGVKLGVGAVSEQGFYYDFEVPGLFAESDLAAVEEEMRKLAANGARAKLEWIPRAEAAELFEARGESWKAEWLREEAELDPVPVFWRGEFADVYPDGCAREAGMDARCSSCLAWRELTGEGTAAIRCCSASTERRSRTNRS